MRHTVSTAGLHIWRRRRKERRTWNVDATDLYCRWMQQAVSLASKDTAHIIALNVIFLLSLGTDCAIMSKGEMQNGSLGAGRFDCACVSVVGGVCVRNKAWDA